MSGAPSVIFMPTMSLPRTLLPRLTDFAIGQYFLAIFSKSALISSYCFHTSNPAAACWVARCATDWPSTFLVSSSTPSALSLSACAPLRMTSTRALSLIPPAARENFSSWRSTPSSTSFAIWDRERSPT